jgi:uncharacterized membrane protein
MDHRRFQDKLFSGGFHPNPVTLMTVFRLKGGFMSSIGFLTAILYTISLAFFVGAAHFPNFFIGGSVLGILTFLGALARSGLMWRNERR